MGRVINRIQWDRLDEVILFILVALLIAALSFLCIKYPGKIPGDAWTVTAVLATAVARTLKRNGKSETEGDSNPTPM